MFLSKINPSIGKIDRYIRTLVVVCVAVIAIDFSVNRIKLSDGYVWIPMSADFSKVSESEGRHRPLFAFTAFLAVKVIEPAFHFIPLETFNPSGSPWMDRLLAAGKKYGIPAKSLFIAGAVWLAQNCLFYIAAVLLGYRAILQWTNSRETAFFFAMFIALSSEMYAWLNHTLINVQGFFILYASLWMLIDYSQTDQISLRKRKLLIYSLLYGLLMLGKAHYNIMAAIGIFTLLFAFRRLWECIQFSLLQSIPLLLWVTILKYGFGTVYANYEISRSDYSMADHLSQMLGDGSARTIFTNFVFHQIMGSQSNIFAAMGFTILLATWLYMGYAIGTPAGKLMLVYFLTTCIFLGIVNFNMARHAADFGPIAYLGLAVFLSWLLNYSRGKEVPPVIFWGLYAMAAFFWGLSNMSDYYLKNIT